MVRQKRIAERLVALFLLGVLLLFPPVLEAFNRPVRVLGLPVLYLYLFAAWALLILLTAVVARRIGQDDAAQAADDGNAPDQAEGTGDA